MKKFVGDITILHMCTKNHNHMRYSSWDTKWDRIFCHFGPFFAFLTPCPPTTHKTKFLKKKKKKTSRDVIILNLRNKKARSYNVCLFSYGVFAQTIFCHFRPVFDFLSHYWLQKLKFGKNVKKYLDLLSFYTCVPLIKIICLVPEIWSSIYVFVTLIIFFCPFYSPNTLKMKISKMKKTLQISSFYTGVPKIMIICYTVPEIWHVSDVIVVFILGYQAFFQALFYSQ